jgi:hypothetical protein
MSQGSSGVELTLAARDGRTHFRIGEPVELELRLRSGEPGRYAAIAHEDKRTVRLPQWDRFRVEPAAGAADPLRDIPAQLGFVSRLLPAVAPLGPQHLVIPFVLNEWISFRTPGKYRVTAETTRVRLLNGSPSPLKLRSSALEIEITAAGEGWAAARLREAVAVLERGDPPVPPTPPDQAQAENDAMARAARSLRFLETPQAARELVRFFAQGTGAAQEELRAGLFGSPHRAEVIAAMEETLSAPDAPVTYYFLGTLIEIASAEKIPPDHPYPAEGGPALEAWMKDHARRLEQCKPIAEEYFRLLAEGVRNKRARARAVSLETLLAQGPRTPDPEILRALVESFADLPENSQRTLLSMHWPRIASPGLEPLLRRVAASPGAARDFALLRWYEVNPETGRQAILERLRRADIGSESRVLMLLPDETLPELDDALAAALEHDKPVEALLARYATAAVLARVRAWAGANPSRACGPLAAYFYRVDPDYAAGSLRDCPLSMAPYEDLLMSPGLERAAIQGLRHPSPAVKRAAQSLLARAGSAQAKQSLWDGFAALRDAEPTIAGHSVEFGYAEALLQGAGWVLTRSELAKLEILCITQSCREYVSSQRRAFLPPVKISLLADEILGAFVGPFHLRTRDSLRRKFAQFPEGAVFHIVDGHAGSWFRERRVAEIRALLEAAGMKLE